MAGVPYKWQAAAVIALGLFLALLDNTIVSVALPVMQRTFSTDLSTITWVGGGYFLAEAAAIPIAGYLCDLRGTRRTYLTAMGIFVVASALCTAAPTKEVLILMRIMQGVGAGIMFPTAYAIAYRAFPPAEWGRATAIIGGPVVLAPAFGPAIGGYLTTSVSWRAIFAVNLPLGLASLLLGWLILRRRTDDVSGEKEPTAVTHFDGAGFVLAVLGFVLLIAGLTEAGVRGWGSPLVEALLAGGAAALLVMVAVERRAPHPVLDVGLFRNGIFARANLLLWILTALYYGGVYLIPYFFEQARGYAALTAGEILIPQGLASAAGIAAAGALYNRLGPRVLAIAGTAALTVSVWGLTDLSPHTSGASLQGWLILRGLGLGLATQPLQNLALSVVARPALARASSLLNVTQQVAGAAGLATLAAYLAGEVTTHLRQAAATCGTACARQQATALGLNQTFRLMMLAYAASVLLAIWVGAAPALSPTMTSREAQATVGEP